MAKKEPKTEAEKKKEKELRQLKGITISTSNLLISIKSFAALLRASISLSDAVQTMSEQSNDKNLNRIYAFMHREIEEGSSLSKAMKLFPKIFPETMVSVVDAGESGASLEKNLLFIAETIKKSYELNRKMRGALIYPSIIITLTLLEFTGMIFIVLPKMEELYKSFTNVPPLTIFIMEKAQAIRDNWLTIFAIALAILITFIIFLKTKYGKYFTSWVSINFPILKNLFISNILASFSRTLGVLLASGLPLSKAMLIAANTMNNQIYQKILMVIHKNIDDGQNMATSLSQHGNYFNKSFIKMVEIGEISGTLEENMMYLHDYYSDDVTEMSNNIVTLVEPLLLILVGIIIGLLGVTILMPIYQLMGSINE
ncbi:type II secretion system F family protein [Candidatus Dojkabacteria bacterium]|nr:type II secretion system F family protein [Candidatus Dojkabacteria bacterium]